MAGRSKSQLELRLPTWGGKRRGAGRKPKNGKAGVAHVARPPLASRYPVHVSLKLLPELGNLRDANRYLRIREALSAGCDKPDFRVCHHSVQSNHIHLIVEAHSAQSLSRGIQGLTVRIARCLNRLLGRKGRVFADRFFSRILRTPREIRNCIAYVLNNRSRHREGKNSETHELAFDPCSNAASFDGWRTKPRSVRRFSGHPGVTEAKTWLLSVGWRRLGLLVPAYVPQ